MNEEREAVVKAEPRKAKQTSDWGVFFAVLLVVAIGVVVAVALIWATRPRGIEGRWSTLEGDRMLIRGDKIRFVWHTGDVVWFDGAPIRSLRHGGNVPRRRGGRSR